MIPVFLEKFLHNPAKCKIRKALSYLVLWMDSRSELDIPANVANDGSQQMKSGQEKSCPLYSRG